MTIQDWGAIGEVLGAVGVIVTLLYLTVQIRQNNRNLHEANSSSISQSLSSLNSRISSSAEFTELFLRGRADIEDLNPVEHDRFRAWVMDLMNLAVYVDGLQSSHNVAPLHYDMVEITGGLYQQYPGIRSIIDSVEGITPRDLVQRFRNMGQLNFWREHQLGAHPATPNPYEPFSSQ